MTEANAAREWKTQFGKETITIMYLCVTVNLCNNLL